MAAGMLEGDSFIFDPIDTFLRRQNDVLPVKSGKKLKDRVDEDVVSDVKTWHAEFEPLAKKAARKAASDREKEKYEAVIKETHFRAQEMCHYINAAIARHPEWTEKLKPRIGSNPDEHLTAMTDMRQRLDDHAAALAAADIKIKLDPQHTSAEIAKQAAAHEVAQKGLTRLTTVGGASQTRLEELRKEGSKLQTRINEQLRAAIPGNRAQQVLFGYQERTVARASQEQQKQDESSQSTQQQSAGDGHDAGAFAGTGTQASTAPATPGPVASGQGTPTPGASGEAPATPGATGSGPETRTES